MRGDYNQAGVPAERPAGGAPGHEGGGRNARSSASYLGPGLQERARYYGVIFLNQMPLSHAASQGDPAGSLRMSMHASLMSCLQSHLLCIACKKH